MSANKITYFLSLFILIPFLTVGQKVANSEKTTRTIDLADKTFIMRKKADTSRAGNDLNLYPIFHQDNKATFRVKKGETIIKDNPLRGSSSESYTIRHDCAVASANRSLYHVNDSKDV